MLTFLIPLTIAEQTSRLWAEPLNLSGAIRIFIGPKINEQQNEIRENPCNLPASIAKGFGRQRPAGRSVAKKLLSANLSDPSSAHDYK